MDFNVTNKAIKPKIVLGRIFGLSYLDAIEKSLEIVNRDFELSKDMKIFPPQTQVETMVAHYRFVDPDKTFNLFCLTEQNNAKLKKEMKAILKLLTHQDSIGQNFVQFFELLTKYGVFGNGTKINEDIVARILILPEECYEVITEKDFKLDRKRFKDSKIYENFKGIYTIQGMPALLPKNEKYGGFIKAFLHTMLLIENKETPEVNIIDIISENRVYFNCKIYSNQKRNEFFKKLDIKEDDCIKWTEIFDKKFPEYKDVYKIFGQIA